MSKTAFFPSPKSIKELSNENNGLGIPAKPGLRLRLITTTVLALSTSMIGHPSYSTIRIGSSNWIHNIIRSND